MIAKRTTLLAKSYEFARNPSSRYRLHS
jgi:hypothetical protein